MTDSIVTRVGRLLRRPPRQIAQRVLDAAGRRTRRPWTHVYPRLLTDRAFLRAIHARDINDAWSALAEQPFFVRPAARQGIAKTFLAAYPEACRDVLASADASLRHEFDLLGSGPVSLGESLPWHTDFKTNRQWPVAYCTDIEYNELDRPSDVKVPWELSRCQHFTRLGQAYWLTGDERYAREFVAETSDWIARNPWGHGVNWACAMDVALRAVSWIWAFYFCGDSAACRARPFRALFLRE